MIPLLLFVLALLGLPSPAPESAGPAGISGRVSLSKGGSPLADASGAVVWIEKLRRPSGAAGILRRNVFIYGVGGIIMPFIFIKLIDLILTATGAY